MYKNIYKNISSRSDIKLSDCIRGSGKFMCRLGSTFSLYISRLVRLNVFEEFGFSVGCAPSDDLSDKWLSSKIMTSFLHSYLLLSKMSSNLLLSLT